MWEDMKTGKLILMLLILLMQYHFSYSSDLLLKWVNAGLTNKIDKFIISNNGKEAVFWDDGCYLHLYNLDSNKIINDYFVTFVEEFIDKPKDGGYVYLNTQRGIAKLNLHNGDYEIAPNSMLPYYDQYRRSILGYACSSTSDTLFLNDYYHESVGGKEPFEIYGWHTYIFDFKNKIFTSFDDKHYDITSGQKVPTQPNKAIAISQSGDKIAMSNDSGYINIYRFNNFKEIILIGQIFTGNDTLTNNLFFSENGNLIVSSHPSGNINIWDVSTCKLDTQFRILSMNAYLIGSKIIDNVIDIKYSDSKQDYDNIYKYHLVEKKLIDSFLVNRKIYKDYSFSDKLELMIYKDDKLNLKVKNPKDSISNNLEITYNIRKILLGDKSQDWLLNSSKDSIIYLQSKLDGSIQKKLNVKRSPIKYLKVSPNEKIFMAVIDNYFQIWDISTESMLSELYLPEHNHSKINLAFCFASDSKSYWVGVGGNNLNNYNCKTGKLIRAIKVDREYPRYIRDIAINSSDTRLAVGSDYSKMHGMHWGYDFVDLTSNQMTNDSMETMCANLTSQMFSCYVDSVTLLNDFIAYPQDVGGQVCTWDLRNLKKITEYVIPYDFSYEQLWNKFYVFKNSPIFILAFNQGTIVFYHINKPEPICDFYSATQITSISVDENDNLLYVMGFNGTVKCFDISGLVTFTDYPEIYKNIDKQELPFYPNPVSEYIEVNTSLFFKNQNVKIFSITGEKLFDEPFANKIDIKDLVPGIYFIQIEDKIFKFIKL
jgi:WD40 repeat protein